MNGKIRVLHLEDNPVDAELIRENLESAGLSCQITRVGDKESFEAALNGERYDLILCDYNLPGYDAMAALPQARDKQAETPVIIISGSVGEDIAVQCLQIGATDYLLKQRLDRLAPSVQRALQEARRDQQRKQAEEALHQSEERFRELAEHSSEGFWFLQTNPERILYVNPMVEKIWGLPAERFYQDARAWANAIHPDDKELVRQIWEEAIQGPQSRFDVEYRVIRPDGSIRWVQDGGTPIRDELGKITRFSGVARDITERKQAAEALRESEARFASAFEFAPIGITLVAPDGRWLKVNRAFCRLVGYTERELLALTFRDLTHPDDLETDLGHMRQLMAAEKESYQMEKRYIHKKGHVIWILLSVSLVRDEKGTPLYYIGQIQDVTEQREAEQRARQALATLDVMADAAIVFDPETLRLTYANQGALHQLGRTREELLASRAVDFNPEWDEKRYREMLATIVNGESKTHQIATLHRHKDGHDVPVEINLQYVAPAGESPRFICIARDVSERKKNEKIAQRSQRLESIGTLAGGIAHDLNNALAPIMMGVELLKMQYPKSSDIVDMFEKSARHGADMVRQLLTFAKGAEGERVPIQPKHLVRDMGNIMQRTFPKNIRLEVKIEDKLPTVLGDPTQLHQVLLNLCVNARDAMPNGGTLWLEALTVEVDATFAGTSPGAKPGKYVQLRVRDTGTGIPPEILDRIFDPFFTTKGPEKGTGLGLSTVLGIVKGNGGFLRVYSQPGKGSTFTAYFPVGGLGSDTAHLKKPDVVFRGQSELILLVDDETNVREVGRAVLRHLNFTPLTATDGVDGLIQAAEHRTELRAIITDMHMPNMDGLAFIRALRRILPNVPVVAASGQLEESVMEELRTLGVTARLNKPFTEGQLAEVLQNCFEKA